MPLSPLRTRAAKQRAQEILRRSIRDSMAQHEYENEVDFYPGNEEEEGGENDSINDTITHSYQTRSAASASSTNTSVEARVYTLESDVAHVKSQVDSMDAKLDLLINSVAFRPAAQSTPPAHRGPSHGQSAPTPLMPRLDRQTPGGEDTQDYRLPHPRELRATQNQKGYVDEMIRKEKFNQPPTEGKTHLSTDVFSEHSMPKPYMYLSREGCHTIKQKLEIRSNISMLEYVNASLALIMDHRAFRPEDREHILAHIQDVTHDAMERPWGETHRWSQHVWDQVEKGNLKWNDHQLIQNQRFRMALSNGNRGNVGGEAKGNSRRECICRAFNTRAGCRHRAHHEEGQVRFMHLCAYCDSVGRQCTGHNIVDCDNKLRGSSSRQGFPPQSQFQGNHGNQGPYRQQPSEGPWRAQQYPQQQQYTTTYQQFPKNAQ